MKNLARGCVEMGQVVCVCVCVHVCGVRVNSDGRVKVRGLLYVVSSL